LTKHAIYIYTHIYILVYIHIHVHSDVGKTRQNIFQFQEARDREICLEKQQPLVF